MSMPLGEPAGEGAAGEPRPPRFGSQFQQLQAYEDAICWRTGRLAAPCQDCARAQGGRCDDHACDERLITSYRQAAHRLARAGPALPGQAAGRATATAGHRC
jgi:hypothetical protein